MPELVESRRRAFRDDRASPDTCVAEPTFADTATRYLDRHVRRHLVPRAYALALYAGSVLNWGSGQVGRAAHSPRQAWTWRLNKTTR